MEHDQGKQSEQTQKRPILRGLQYREPSNDVARGAMASSHDPPRNRRQIFESDLPGPD